MVARVQEFTGRIQDMSRDEMVHLLGYLASAVERLLGQDPGTDRCSGPGRCLADEPCAFADVCAGYSE